MRYLTVNADDFGFTRGVNCGILEAHDRGIVTSASLMVERPAATEAADEARERPRLGVGLHAEVGRWSGYADGLDDWCRTEREQEVRALCDPRVLRDAEREDVRLCSFAEGALPVVAESAS
jgi:predicted glycoside hydrolase/deacetylase ChbG (UPF0249 family)